MRAARACLERLVEGEEAVGKDMYPKSRNTASIGKIVAPELEQALHRL